MTTDRWIQKHTQCLSAKTIAVSGATGGIGQHLGRQLLKLGARLILLDRNTERSLALRAQLLTHFPSAEIDHIRLDLEDVHNVEQVAEILIQSPPDGLILNAGAYHIPRRSCATGYNNIFQINFASPYYLARRLPPAIQQRGGRIVAVGSIAHRYSRTDSDDTDFSTSRADSRVYGNAKRHLMFALYGLCNDGTLSVTHPGITLTGITAHYPKLIFALIKHPMKVIFMSPRRASLCILRGLFEGCDKNEWIGPRIFDIWGLPKKRRLRSCDDVESAHIYVVAEEAFQRMKELCTEI